MATCQWLCSLSKQKPIRHCELKGAWRKWGAWGEKLFFLKIIGEILKLCNYSRKKLHFIFFSLAETFSNHFVNFHFDMVYLPVMTRSIADAWDRNVVKCRWSSARLRRDVQELASNAEWDSHWRWSRRLAVVFHKTKCKYIYYINYHKFRKFTIYFFV